MTNKKTSNLRIKNINPLISPALLSSEYPDSKKTRETVDRARIDICNILDSKDDRLVVVIGPCSIHDTKAALEYAERLKEAADKYQNELCIIMRVYFEKPRTTVGWKGIINDPYLNGTFSINNGLRLARELLININEMGLPTGTEFLDTTIPQFISDLISWAAIGARTTESQIHRELASGLSMPVGFKNGTGGSIKIAVDATLAAKHPHHFLGVNNDGLAGIVTTSGNQHCHIILRGSSQGPNYDKTTIDDATAQIKKADLIPRLMVDCSHGNSRKDHSKQISVLQDVCQQITDGSDDVFGVMIESHLVEGNQKLTDIENLTYGQSITDACIGWDDSLKALDILQNAVKQRRGQ